MKLENVVPCFFVLKSFTFYKHCVIIRMYKSLKKNLCLEEGILVKVRGERFEPNIEHRSS